MVIIMVPKGRFQINKNYDVNNIKSLLTDKILKV